MRWLEEYRDAEKIHEAAAIVQAYRGPSVSLMEVCGGQTHSIVKYGLERFLPPTVTLIHGPGCPVCVTPIERIEKAQALAAKEGVILCTFGDMLRVPGRRKDLRQVKAEGGDIRLVYSPLEALKIAKKEPKKQVVFFSVGFETTAPATAMTLLAARQEGVMNLSFLVSHVLVPPAIEAIIKEPSNAIRGFLLAGHVCAVMGVAEYRPLCAKFSLPLVVTGFEPLDILQGLILLLRQIEEGRVEVENQYSRSVRLEGNEAAQRILRQVFAVVDQEWRGIGVIPQSGYRLRPDFSDLDAEIRFPFDEGGEPSEPSACQSGAVLQGRIKPPSCPLFGTICTPENPVGAPMVSSEGACSAYYLYRTEEARA